MIGIERSGPSWQPRRLATAAAVSLAVGGASAAALASAVDDPATQAAVERALPRTAPDFMASTYRHMMQAPLPAGAAKAGRREPSTPRRSVFQNAAGWLGQYLPDGPVPLASNAFFQPLGSNGRSCATCHDPAAAMSLTLDMIRDRFVKSAGRDPLFAPVDGATCPGNVAADDTAASPLGGRRGHGKKAAERALEAALDPVKGVESPYYALLARGLIRVALPIPQNAEFTIKVVSDPFGCNTDPDYDRVVDPKTGVATKIVSIYRRPIMSANLRFRQRSGADFGLFGSAPGVDPFAPPADPNDPTRPNMTPDPYHSGRFLSGNIMWDGREPTLESQAIDAVLGHAQALAAPTAAQVAQIVDFETGVYSAQGFDDAAGRLVDDVRGGPIVLSRRKSGRFDPTRPAFDIFDSWEGVADPAQAAIARGQKLFNSRQFTVSNVSGFNDVVGNAAAATCSTCHNQPNVGMDALPHAQHEIGLSGGGSGRPPARDLPVFQVTCKAGASTPYDGRTVLTNDPGKALISGRCADVGRMTVASLRGLASHAPYFHDGSAGSVADVVGFYDRRFSIGLTYQEKADLVAFLQAL